MISREEFSKLKNGDLLLWRNKYYRTVFKGPVDYGGYMSVTLPIRTKSWTKRIYTVYGYNDLRNIVSVSKKCHKKLMLMEEWSKLGSVGFDVKSELKRELKEQTECCFRMGRQPCKNYSRIKKFIENV